MGRAKRPWQVKKFYQDIIDNGLSPSFVTYAALLHAYGRARYGDDAFKIYREMKEKGLGLNVVLYNSILAMCTPLEIF
jgi:pentatricopeptide repeat protein